MNCRCGRKAVAEGMCRIHYIQHYETIYSDNTDVNNLGVVKWAERFLPEYTTETTPEMHKEFYQLLLSLYNPQYRNRYDRQRLIKSYRESAKSTVATMIFPAYLICHNGKKIKIKVPVARIREDGTLETREEIVEVIINEKLIVIASKTGSLAEEFVVRIRNELSSNEWLKYFYGGKIQNAKDDLEGEWTKKAFKFNNCFILGVGTGMQIRGRIKGASRATFIIFDDIYDEENAATEIQRKKIRYWFNGAALNSVDNIRGKAVLVGTILHQDTVMIDCEKDKRWKTIYFTPMPPEYMKTFISEHLKPNYDRRQCNLPFDEIPEEMERIARQQNYFDNIQKSKDWKLTWKERNDLYFLAVKFSSAVQKGLVSLFWQEYFHITIPEEKKRFIPQHFKKVKEWRLFREFGYLWFESDVTDNKPVMINTEFGLDIGGGGIDGDNTAIVPVGMLSDNRIIVFPAQYGKWEIRDVLEGSPQRDTDIELDRDKIQKIGFADELYRLSLVYYPSVIKIGIAGEEKLHIPNVERLFRANESYINIIPRMQMQKEGRKHERIMNTLLPYYQAGMVYHCTGNDLLELELENLTSFTSDDIADSLEVGIFQLQSPGNLSYEYFTELKTPKRRGRYYPNVLRDYDEPFDWLSQN